LRGFGAPKGGGGHSSREDYARLPAQLGMMLTALPPTPRADELPPLGNHVTGEQTLTNADQEGNNENNLAVHWR
jgi:hypothetical protein